MTWVGVFLWANQTLTKDNLILSMQTSLMQSNFAKTQNPFNSIKYQSYWFVPLYLLQLQKLYNSMQTKDSTCLKLALNTSVINNIK